MFDPFSVEGMLSERPLEHFPSELLVKIENFDGSPTGKEKIVIVCGCDTRYSYELGHNEDSENDAFLDILFYVQKKEAEEKIELPDWNDFG